MPRFSVPVDGFRSRHSRPGVGASSGFSAETEKDADFKPIKEAELPKGFPTYTPVGTIEVKQYPAARLAQAKLSGDSAFWKLFLHIETHSVAMTAPVQMEYRSDAQGKPKQTSMAFFYGDPTAGTAGPAGRSRCSTCPL